MSRNLIITVLTILGIIGIGLFVYAYSIIYRDNTNLSENKEIFIHTGSSYDDVILQLEENNILKDVNSFKKVAKLMKYGEKSIPPGKYIIKKGSNNKEIITKLRAGDQDAIKLTINNIRILPELAGRVSKYFEADSITFLNYLNDISTLEKFNKSKETLMTCFLPDTYEMLWTDSPDKVFTRLYNHRQKFFEKQAENLKNIGLNPEEAYTLASIVDRESNLPSEHATIAGLYLNRLRIGERLAADPTVVFALQDFTIKRVLYTHLGYDSPYNTYKYAGLPPGPICMPSMSCLNGVLNPEKHDYIFFCAKPGYNSGHNFAVTSREHANNARAYHNWLNSEGIK